MEKTEFYKSLTWKKLRSEHLKNNPYCANMLCFGVLLQATDVHHIIPYGQESDPELQYELATDPENFVSLSNEAHHDLHGKKKYIHPNLSSWLYQMKLYLTRKYLTQGKIITFGIDNAHKKSYKK